MDELLLAEASEPSVERETESPFEYGLGEGELPASAGGLPGPASFARDGASGRPKKSRSAIFIGAACVLVVLLVGIVVWYSLAGSGTAESERKIQLREVQVFAEEYIALLEDGRIDRAAELLSSDLRSDVPKDEIETFAKQIGKSKIVELDCTLTHFEERPEGNQILLWYDLRYEQGGQAVIVSVAEINEDLRINAIAVQEPLGGTAAIGPSDFGELSEILLTATFEKYAPIFTKFFCGFLLIALVLGLVQIISMWVVFEKADQPGWAVLVPFYNMWVLAEVADKPGWLGLLACFCGAIPFVGQILQVVLWLVISIGVAKTFGRGVLFGIGLFIVPLVFYPILAFARD
jgi:hypothetical protein